MQYSDTTNNNGLLQDCERIIYGEYGAITDNTSRLQEFTALINQALDETATDIMEVDRNWKWDDRNHGDAPIARANLVSGQDNYQLSVDFMKIDKVEVVSEDDVSHVLYPINEEESDLAFEETFEQSSLPTYFQLRGSNIYIHPAPNYNKTEGLVVYYQRTFDHFDTTDTTKKPGCPSIFHPLISLRAAYKHAFANQMPIANDLEKEIYKYIDKMRGHMRTRNARGRNKLLPKYKSSK